MHQICIWKWIIPLYNRWNPNILGFSSFSPVLLPALRGAHIFEKCPPPESVRKPAYPSRHHSQAQTLLRLSSLSGYSATSVTFYFECVCQRTRPYTLYLKQGWFDCIILVGQTRPRLLKIQIETDFWGDPVLRTLSPYMPQISENCAKMVSEESRKVCYTNGAKWSRGVPTSMLYKLCLNGRSLSGRAFPSGEAVNI